jgi:hypothetical protein
MDWLKNFDPLSWQQLPAWLGLGIAALVAFIAYLQFRTAREQWRTANNRATFDLFEKRYAVYQDVRDVVGKLMGPGRADPAMFVKAAEKARFLFGKDVVTYLDQFASDLGDLESLGAEEADLQGDDLRKNRDSQRRLKNKIESFRAQGPPLFGRYIRFDQQIR